MPVTFHGGIRFPNALRARKKTACQCALTLFLPESICLPLTVKNTELQACVTTGDTVGVGDRLAYDPQGVYPPLHSGLSGRVEETHNSGQTVDGRHCTVLSVIGDGQQTPGQLLPALPSNAEPSQIVQRMYDAGLVGLGGAGFPTFQKYRHLTARYLLINACECEPLLAADTRLIIDCPDSVSDGITWLMRAAALSPNRVVLCAEQPDALAGLRRLAATKGWRTVRLPEHYPQGSERQLLYSVFGKELPAGRRPTDCGVVVSNVSTAVAMADAARGLPLTHRAVTVSGTVAHPCNLLVPIGTPLRALAAQAQPLITGRRSQLIAGGPLTGVRAAHADAGLPKACGGITVLPTLSHEETPCIRCGACVRACPSRLVPFLLDRAGLAGDFSLCRTLHATACIACGCCSYVCPAHRPLAARITALRQKEASI